MKSNSLFTILALSRSATEDLLLFPDAYANTIESEFKKSTIYPDNTTLEVMTHVPFVRNGDVYAIVVRQRYVLSDSYSHENAMKDFNNRCQEYISKFKIPDDCETIDALGAVVCPTPCAIYKLAFDNNN